MEVKLKNVILHFHTVNKHRWIVFKLCVKAGIPWRGIVHDLSKYSPTEFWESAKYYQGNRSPIFACVEDKGYSNARVHHLGRNKHHPYYWYDDYARIKEPIIPYKYVAEMICDKLAAGIVYEGKNWKQDCEYNYYLKERENAIIHVSIDKILMEVFLQVKENGIKKTLKRRNIKDLYNKYCKNV